MFARLSILVLFFFALVAQTAGAATVGYTQDWDDAGAAEAGWMGMVSTSTSSWQATGGNGGGYLRTSTPNAVDAFDSGARALGNVGDVTGDFRDKLWTLRFDILLEEGTLDGQMLRLRGSAPGRGWVRDLPGTLAQGNWTRIVVSFDGNWSEAQARANGWSPDNEHPILDPTAPGSNTWADTVMNVRALSVRLSGGGSALTTGIDNFLLDGVTSIVPEPSTALLMGLGLAGLAGVRRR